MGRRWCRMVSEDARNAGRGHLSAAALPSVFRSRQQSRLVYVHPERNPAARREGPPAMAPADSRRLAPDGRRMVRGSLSLRLSIRSTRTSIRFCRRKSPISALLFFPRWSVRERAGVVTNAIFDAFTPGRSYQHYHGGVRILMEAASARLASPLTVSSAQMKPGPDFDPTEPSWNFPLPWEPGVWKIGDVDRLSERGRRSLSAPRGAVSEKNGCRAFTKSDLNAVTRREPYAFIIPADQKDPQSLLDLLDILPSGTGGSETCRE